MKSPFAIAFAALPTALFVIGCASGKSFEGGVYREGKVAFQVSEPAPGWRSIEVKAASLAFRDDGGGATILVNARCSSQDGDTPLLALTNHLLMGTTERDLVMQATEPFDGREALHSIVRAKLDGVLMAFDLFVAKKDGCIYDFVHVAVDGAGDLAAFERFVRSFHTLPAR